MNKIRKFFRGSGRVLAFIFVASVIWLLFDMAALRLSFSEINTRILKEDIVRREQIGFKVQPDQMKILYSSEKEIKPPLRGRGKGAWDKENFRKIEENMPKAIDDLDQTLKKRKMPKAPGRGKVVPLWHPVHLQTLPVTVTKPENKGRDIKPKASSHQVTSRQTKNQRAQKTPIITVGRTPVVKISVHTGPLSIKQKTPKSHSLRSDTSKQARERDLNVTVSLNTDRSKHQSQTMTNERTHPASSPMPKSGKAFALNKTETQSKELNANKQNANNGLPFSKFTANSNHLKKQSINETQLGGLPKDGGANVAHGKKLNLSESHVVIITKEEELKTDTKEIPNYKTQTIFPKLLDESQGKHISKNKSKASFSSFALQKVTVSQTNQPLAGGLELARINLTAADQPAEYNQSHIKALSPEDHGMHHVLKIDVTLSPRDPKAPGQFGRPVVVPHGKEKEAERRWKEGNFNVYLSDLIPVDRAIEDTRPAGCAEQLVHNNLPTTSVIMCFVDEVWSTLLRSVHSVLNRSPPHLIKEILLVDDFSTKDYLKDNLDKYMLQFPKVRILRLKERHGLIRARLAGAQNATDRMKTVERNLVRVAEVWLDEYKELFYGHGDHLIDQGLDVGNLTQQRELRKKLKCKSFKWYLENVFPDLKAPIVRANGVLINVALGKCISIENTTAILEDCDGSSQDDTAVVGTTMFCHQHPICSILLADIQSAVIHRAANHQEP
ncbi:Polypeptide N-acetylgalactosaminyltransferase 5 [Tupaia chinensis]|uniref:Polypeptide N-acetylgalactosaminyltransferase 5 n=1 Tax=Tupaia chinensis TaxID=246437 RepID=L8Y388_TUPCH|nr:Polypeptide N-acetylgalactosaminyltransferase 5 [Tupaia chinensis]